MSEDDDGWGGASPFDPEFRDDPYPRLARLRETDPVNQTPVGIWRLLRYRDVERLLNEVKCGTRTTDGILPGVDESAGVQRRFMLQQDPPDHTRLRKLVSRAFTPRSLEAWKTSIQKVVDDCLDRVAGKGEMDLVADLALPVPSTIICEMLGVPISDRPRFTQWTAQATLGLAAAIFPPDVIELATSSGLKLAEYFDGLIAERRKDLREDLLSDLIRAEEAGDRLTTDELMSQAVGLLIAGFETTIGLIANGARALIRHPAELEKLRERPDLGPKAVQECLRYEGPILLTPRILHEDVEFDGKPMTTNTMVWAMLSSANRDPEKFPDPDRFDIERDASQHVAFGGGIHFCLGYRLAELEARAALTTLATRFADLHLRSDKVEWGISLFRVPGTLPVTFKARG